MQNLTLFLLFFTTFLFGQPESKKENYALLLKSGIIVPGENISDWDTQINYSTLKGFDKTCYVLIQFYEMPAKSDKKAMLSSGIELLSYLPHNAWFASIQKGTNISSDIKNKIRCILQVKTEWKLSPELKNYQLPEHVKVSGDKADFMLHYYKNADAGLIKDVLLSRGAEIIKKHKNTSCFTIRVNQKNGLEELCSLPFVKFMEAIPPPSIHDDTKGRSLHRSNTINTDYSSGLKYNGQDVSIAIADDGSVSHIDFKGRLTDLTEQGQAGGHGDMTSGICLGAANLNPVYRGMADGAHLVLFDIFGSSLGDYPQIVNAVDNFNTYQVVIASTSYSQGCNVYNNSSKEGDELLHENKQLMFVFSGGNNNGNDCGYGAGNNWGNITGGYKQGKNVTTCANIDPLGVIDPTSSHGPASDGRIKPDISANGRDQISTDENNTYQVGGGTSAAAPGVAGCFAQLYQAYKERHNGNNPDGALIKAMVLNTANDIGNPGPDFTFGWGQINMRNAFTTLDSSSFLKDSVFNGQLKTHLLTIPPGTQQAKIMLYWNDVEGDPIASRALVNNADFTLYDPNQTLHYPLVLNPAPNAVTLNQAAVPGTDTLNNMEQITLSNPMPGNYTLRVNGTEIPDGPQTYYLLWHFESSKITLTYPNGGEGFVPQETELLRWDAIGDTGTFTLEYSIDDGSTYQPIASGIAGTQRQFLWSVPTALSGKCLIKVSRNGISDLNDVHFSIIKVPLNLYVVAACPDSVRLQWSPVSGATGYVVYKLGSMYMDSAGYANTTQITLTGINGNDEHWFSVKALGTDDAIGRRSLAVRKAPGTFNCFLTTDAALSSSTFPSSGNYRNCSINANKTVSLYIKNYSASTINSCPVSFLFNGNQVTETFNGSILPADSSLFIFSSTINLSVTGNYTLKLWVSLPADQNAFNDTVSYPLIVHSGNLGTPPLTETFQAVFPPLGYLVYNPDQGLTWEEADGIIGSDGLPTRSAAMKNYYYSGIGQQDILETQLLDLTNATFGTFLTFDLSYSRASSTTNDRLKIEVSSDCGTTFVPTIYNKIGPTLATVAGFSNSEWSPTSTSDWRRDTLMLTNWQGQQVMIRFVNTTASGNNLYVDNINVEQNVFLKSSQLDDIAFDIRIFPNPNSGSFQLSSNHDCVIRLYTISGEMVENRYLRKGNGNSISVKNLSPGMYFIYGDNGMKVFTEKIIVNP